jgi:hypothetical protein
LWKKANLRFNLKKGVIIWVFLFFACGSLSNIYAQEQDIDTNHLWFDFYNYFPITEKLEYGGDLGFRHAPGPDITSDPPSPIAGRKKLTYWAALSLLIRTKISSPIHLKSVLGWE